MKVVLKNHKTKMDWSWPPVVNFEVLPFAHFCLNLDEIQNGVSLPLVLSPLKIQSLPYDPHSINLQILNFLLKFVIKFCIKWAPIAGKYHVDHVQKENSKNVDLNYQK